MDEFDVIVIGSGVAVAGLGAGFLAIAGNKDQQFDEGFQSECPNGCYVGDPVDSTRALPGDVADLHSQAQAWRGAAAATMAVGGAAIATGVTLMILNSPKPVRTRETARGPSLPSVAPTADFSGATVNVQGRF